MERVIFHCDLNSFFASVELLSHPELRHLPVAVCGDPESRHGIILAKNEHAKRFAVKTAETIWQAKKKCPDLVLLPARQDYRAWSRRVNEIYIQYTDLVEPFGVDESWLDVTGTLHLFGGDAPALADELRRRVREELGLTISIGVSFNKIFAKLGSDYKKPDATTVISKENFRQLVWPLPATDLLYVGKSAARALQKYGIRTIGQLAEFDREALSVILGKQGAALHDYANGQEHAPVRPAGWTEQPKSVGNGLTFPKDLQGEEEVRGGVVMLCDRVAARLRKYQLKCSGVQVTLRDPGFHTFGRQTQLDCATCNGRDLSKAAMNLIKAHWNLSQPLRAITVTAISLIPGDQALTQLTLFGEDSQPKLQRQTQLDHAVDQIRARFGTQAIAPASGQQKHKRTPPIPPPGGR